MRVHHISKSTQTVSQSLTSSLLQHVIKLVARHCNLSTDRPELVPKLFCGLLIGQSQKATQVLVSVQAFPKQWLWSLLWHNCDDTTLGHGCDCTL